MKNFILDNVSTIVAFLAVVISLLTVVYTRKNIKTQKYIETVTNQRILWIDTLRNDFSQILSHTSTLRFCQKVEIDDKEVGYPGDDPSSEDLYEYNDFVRDISHEKKLRESKNYEIVTKIELSILRLNDDDDINLIKDLEKLKRIYQGKYYLEIDDKYIERLRKNIKKILKAEWEKVKQETVRGGLKRERKNSENILGL